MVDMTGRKFGDGTLPSLNPVKPKASRRKTDEDRMIGSAALMSICGFIFGLGWQFEQWWLVCGCGVALVMLYHLFTMYQERIERPLACPTSPAPAPEETDDHD